MHDDSETFITSQPLTDADRKVISLDDRPSPDFQALCQSVVSLRLLFSLPAVKRNALPPEDLASFFQLDQRLGQRDVNDMISIMLKRSGRPLAKQIRAAAERLSLALSKSSRRIAKRYEPTSERLPFYEAYVLLHWSGHEDAFKAEFNEQDVQVIPGYAPRFGESGFDAWIRRKQRAALLQLASKLGFRRLPLAGKNVVVSLADGSIRDFLEIMGEIFEVYVTEHGWDQKDPENLEKFATSRTQIAGDIQTKGIYRASAAYVDGISHRSEIDVDVISRLVAGLGHYTATLQANGSDPRVLASAERGVFFVDYSIMSAHGTAGNAGRFVEAALRQAELAGYLRSVQLRRPLRTSQTEPSVRSLSFRLHRRFSPHFRFSFRGAYEPITLDPRDIIKLCQGPQSVDPLLWAETLAGAAHAPDDPQFMLPFAENLEDDE